jgi:hypothetical protein
VGGRVGSRWGRRSGGRCAVGAVGQAGGQAVGWAAGWAVGRWAVGPSGGKGNGKRKNNGLAKLRGSCSWWFAALAKAAVRVLLEDWGSERNGSTRMEIRHPPGTRCTTEMVPSCYPLGTDLLPTSYPSAPIYPPRRDPIGNNLISFWCKLRTHLVPNWYPFDSNSDTHCIHMVATMGRRRGRVPLPPSRQHVQTLATHRSSCAA